MEARPREEWGGRGMCLSSHSSRFCETCSRRNNHSRKKIAKQRKNKEKRKRTTTKESKTKETADTQTKTKQAN